jgi:hypothetical protein
MALDRRSRSGAGRRIGHGAVATTVEMQVTRILDMMGMMGMMDMMGIMGDGGMTGMLERMREAEGAGRVWGKGPDRISGEWWVHGQIPWARVGLIVFIGPCCCGFRRRRRRTLTRSSTRGMPRSCHGQLESWQLVD